MTAPHGDATRPDPRACPTRAILIATLLGLILRVGFALAQPIDPTEDAGQYHALARSLASGRGYVDDDGRATAFRPPGLPGFLALAYRAAPPVPVTGRLALAIAATLVVPATAVLARNLAGARAAKVSAFAAAVYPPFVASWFSPRALLSEPLATALVATAVAMAVELDRRPSAWRAPAAGLAIGLGGLTKPTLLLVCLPVAVFVARRCGRWRAAALLVATAGVILPWTARNAIRLGHPVPVSTNGGISIWTSYNPSSRGLGNAEQGYDEALSIDAELRRRGLGEVERSRYFLSEAVTTIRTDPGRALWLIGRKTILFWDPTLKDWSRGDPPLRYNLAYGAILPLALAGAILALAGTRVTAGAAGGHGRAVASVLVGVVAAIAGAHILLHTDVRYRVVLEPFLLAFAGVALVALLARVGARAGGAVLTLYALGHAWIAWRYDAVFAALKAVVGGLGLG